MRSALTRSHLPGTLWIFFTFGFDLTLPAGLADTGDLTLVGQLPEADTAYAVIPQVSMGSAADLAAIIAAAGELRLSLLLQDHRLFSHLLIPPKSSGEGSAQKRQQLLGLLVGGSGGADADVHTTDLVHLVILDLRENQLLLQAEGVVAAAVEGIGVDAAEVTDTGQRHAEQTVQELVHLIAAEGDLHADGLAFTHLEVSHALAGLAGDGLLAGDGGDVLADGFDFLGVVLAFAAADVHDDLVQLGDLHNALVAELLVQSGSDLSDISFFHSASHEITLLSSDFGAALAADVGARLAVVVVLSGEGGFGSLLFDDPFLFGCQRFHGLCVQWGSRATAEERQEQVQLVCHLVFRSSKIRPGPHRHTLRPAGRPDR